MKTTRTSKCRQRLASVAAGLLCLSVTAAARAQQAPAAGATATDNAEGEEEMIVLSPFEVTTSGAVGYEAAETLAGSRLKTPLRDVASPITVVTARFLADTGAKNVQDLLVYTTNTEVAGIAGNFYGSTATDVDFARNQALRPQNQTRVRGLFGADLTRDFWTTDIPLDSYNITGVEIQRGPNSILYGLGSPAGIINYSLKAPMMGQNRSTITATADSFGSLRSTVDFNRVLLPGTLALRFNGLAERRKFLQDDKYDDNRRWTISPRWTPKLADTVYTQFTVNYEEGRRKANAPSITPPVDYMSNWYTRMGKYTPPNEFAPYPANIEQYFAGFRGAGAGNWYDELAAVFGNPNSGVTGGQGIADVIRQRGGDPFGTFAGVANARDNATNPNHELAQKSYYQNRPEVMAIINAMEQSSGRTFSGFTGWQPTQILDRSTFDFWKDDVAGPNNTVWNDFKALNLSFVQTYLNGDAGVEVVYDKQEYFDGFDRFINDPLRIGIDINRYLRAERANFDPAQNTNDANGVLSPAAANPNFGRPFTISGTAARENREIRESSRATAYYKFDLEDVLDRETLLTRIFGEQTLTGVASRQVHHHFNYDWDLYGIGEGFGPYTGQTLWGLHYLGSRVDAGAAAGTAGLGITGVNSVHQPPTSVTAQIHDERGQRTIPQYGIVNADTLNADFARERLLTGGSDFRTRTTTRAFIWQSKFLDDNVSGLFGLRKDNFFKQIKGTIPTSPPDARNNPGAVQGRPNPLDPEWTYNPANNLSTSGTTRTYGLMLHSPDFINRRLPWGTKVSIGYNEASNINPSDVGFSVFRTQIPAQSGKTKDYNLLVTTLDDRLSMRLTKYEMSQQYANLDSAPRINDIRESLNRTLNGIMVEASYTGNRRINTTPEFIVNKWFFGGTGASGNFVPGSWTSGSAEQRAAMLKDPLLVRAAAQSWGDPTTHRNSDGSVVSQPTISDEELAYRRAWFEARTDAEWQRPLGAIGPELFTAMDFRRVPNGPAGTGFTWASTNVPSFKSTTDIETEGYELELTANITRNWRVIFNGSKANAVNANVLGDEMVRYYEAMRAVAKDGFTFNDVRSGGDNWSNGSDYWHRTGFAQIDEWGDEGLSNNHQMLGEKWTVADGGFGVEERYINARSAEGRAIRELREYHFNFISTYDFTRGALKGFGVGGAIRYQGNTNLGFYPKFDASSGMWVSDLDKPIKGPSETNYDAWCYYKRKVFRDVDMTIQLNLRNLFAGKELIPISANPDGTVGQYRLGATTSAELTTRFDF